MNKAHPFEQRAVMVALSADRAREQEHAKDQGSPQPGRIALRKIMACTYLELRIECEEYKEKKGQLQGTLDDGRTFFRGATTLSYCVVDVSAEIGEKVGHCPCCHPSHIEHLQISTVAQQARMHVSRP